MWEKDRSWWVGEGQSLVGEGHGTDPHPFQGQIIWWFASSGNYVLFSDMDCEVPGG